MAVFLDANRLASCKYSENSWDLWLCLDQLHHGYVSNNE